MSMKEEYYFQSLLALCFEWPDHRDHKLRRTAKRLYFCSRMPLSVDEQQDILQATLEAWQETPERAEDVCDGDSFVTKD